MATAAEMEYLYINASEGTASGGHAALKLGDEVYHFQHVPPGLLRIKRDGFAEFRQQYGERENRTIRLHRVEVSAETQDRLREHFNRILLIEDEQFDRRDDLQDDRRLLQAFLRLSSPEEDQSAEPSGLDLKGLGLFFPEGWNPSAAVSPAIPDSSLNRLVLRIEAVHGSGFLADKASGTLQALQALRPEDYRPETIALAEDLFQPAGHSYAGRYAGHLTGLAALRVLALGLPLAEGVLLRPEGEEFRLDGQAMESLAAYRTKLEGQMLGLLSSQRADWGFPLLLGMARLIALDASLSSGRLAVLDLKGSAAEEIPAFDPEQARQAYEWSRSRWLAAKAGLDRQPMDEWAYVRLEQAANQFHEVGQALREGRSPSLSGMTVSPTRPARAGLIPPSMGTASLQANLARLDRYSQAYEAKLEDLYAYNLVGRNCASEIFRAVGLAMQEGISPHTDRAGYDFRLGGQVSGQGLAFIPFLSFEAVKRHWRVIGSEELPSYRQRRLEQAKAQENPLLVELRESNVLSARLYHWHAGDAAFLFFSDDKVWARPLAGGFNLAAGLGQGLVGVFTAPWDGGENLWQGTKGALISLPELVFFNIRKGSFPGLNFPL